MSYTAAVAATDHNLYIKGRYAYLSNYLSGLRILDLAQIDGGSITEAAFFDTHPESNAAGTSGAWSIYPYFDSGTVILSDISSGLFVLKPDLCTGPETVIGLSATAAGDQQIALNWAPGEAGASFEVYRSIDGCGGPETQIAQGLTSNSLIDSPVSGGISYGYRVRQRSADLRCVSEFSTCQAAQTTGLCTAPPNFAGISSAQSAGTASCAINLGWPDANARCSGPVTFTVQRSAGTEFIAAVLVGAGLGYLIDLGLGTSPWGLLILLLMGFAAGILNVIRVVAEMNAASPAPKGADLGPEAEDEERNEN